MKKTLNAQRRTTNAGARSIAVAILLMGAGGALAQGPNVRVVNPPTLPVPVYNVGSPAGGAVADKPLSVQTAATGTNWATFPSAACTALVVENTTGTILSVRIGGGGTAFPLLDSTAVKLYVAANANEVQVQRADTSNTQVTAYGIATK